MSSSDAADAAILHARVARILANASSASAMERAVRLVVFRRGPQRLAFRASQLAAVRPLPALTRMPRMPGHVRGLLHLDGKVLAAADLLVLEEPSAPMPASPWGLWATHADKSAVVVADELLELMDIAEEKLEGALKGAFSGPLASLVGTVLPGPILVLDSRLLLESDLFLPLDR